MKYENTIEYIEAFKEKVDQSIGTLDLTTPNYSPDSADAVGRILLNTRAIDILIDVKSQISSKSQLKNFLNLSQDFDGILVIISSSIKPKAKEALKLAGIGFYILDQELYLPISLTYEFSSSPLAINQIKKTGFKTDTKLALMLYLISKPEALNFSFRKLAEALGVSATAVVNSQKSLILDGLIIQQGRKRFFGNIREYVNFFKRLYRKNVINHYMGRFSTKAMDGIKLLANGDMDNEQVIIGGEPAAARITSYLNPAEFTFHTYEEKINSLAKDYRLWRDKNGPIKVYRAFWPDELNQKNKIAPDLVIVADLLNSGFSRNIETAELLIQKLEESTKDYVL